MTTAEIPGIDRTMQQFHQWIREINQAMGWDDGNKQMAYHGLRAVLHALRDRVGLGEATDLGAQLPMLVRGMYYDEWKPMKTPGRDRSKEAFLETVGDYYSAQPVNLEDMTRAVFTVIARHVDDGEVEKIVHSLPKNVRHLWPTE